MVSDSDDSLLDVTMNFAAVFHGRLRDFLEVLSYAQRWTKLNLIYRTKSFQPLRIVKVEADKNSRELKRG